jgi:hypothetical protein
MQREVIEVERDHHPRFGRGERELVRVRQASAAGLLRRQHVDAAPA